MNIVHHPIFDKDKVEKFYSEKDGVTIYYVCTSAPNAHATYAADIFYRETPHPEFDNHYFGLYYNHENQIMITNVDMIETLEFGMVEGANGWEYSQHRHDYRSVGDVTIDGGRSYVKRGGNLSVPCKTMKVINGKFEELTGDNNE